MGNSPLDMQVVVQNYGWILVSIVALLVSLSGISLVTSSAADEFERDTGVSWEKLSGEYPTVAAQFLMTRQSALVTTTAVALIALAVAYFAFRTGQRWAWFAMWIMPASMAPGIISLFRTENQRMIAYFGAFLVLLAVAGLLVSIPVFFPRIPLDQ
jgi:ABC-type spermidine/putrescine transport system permease subunit I